MKNAKRVLCFVIALMCVILCACSNKSGQAVVEYKVNGKTQGSIDTGFMYFWISFQKSMYSSVASNYEDGWEHIVDDEKGNDLYDLLLTESKESARKLLAIEYMHDKEYKLKLSDEVEKELHNQLESYVSLYGSVQVLESELSKYGASINTLRRYFQLMLKQNALLEHLYGKEGKELPSNEEIKAFFKDNYVIVDHIFFSLAGGVKEDGTVVSMPEEDIQKQREKAREVYNRITALGEDFDTLKEEYTEDIYVEQYYPHGFFVTNDSAFPAEFTGAVMTLSVGEVSIVENAQSGIHIVKRLPMDENLYNAYDDVYANLVSAVSSENFTKLITERAQNAVVNDALFEDYDPSVIEAFALG